MQNSRFKCRLAMVGVAATFLAAHACHSGPGGLAPRITGPAAPLTSGEVGAAYSVTFTATGVAPLAWDVAAGSLPPGLALDGSSGELSGTPTAAGTGSFTIRVTNAYGSATRPCELQVAGVGAAAPTITGPAATLPDAVVGTPYTLAFTATGAVPIEWARAGGSLPLGLALDPATGVLSGTPIAAGTAAFTVSATNAAGVDTKSFTLTVVLPGSVPVITGPSSPLPEATLGAPYSVTFKANGSTPITWSLLAGALPAGLWLDPATGAVSGTPTAAGTASFTVAASNAWGADSQACQLEVTQVPVIHTLTPAEGVVGGTVRIAGSGFGSTVVENSVLFDAIPATVLAASATELEVEVPAGIAATAAVTVTVDGEVSDGETFTLDPTSVVFVDSSAAGAADGSSWTDAYPSLKAALAAATAGQEVWVAAGTYKPGSDRADSFELVADVGVYGGFAGEEAAQTQRDFVANPTILSGDVLGDDVGFTNNGENNCHVVIAVANSTLDGFSVVHGNANAGGLEGGGCVVVVSGPATLANLVIAYGVAPGEGGGGLYTESAVRVEGCVFHDCVAIHGGAVMAAFTVGVEFSRCVFARNLAGGVGGAVCSLSEARFENVLFSGNEADYGGAIYQYFHESEIVNVTFHGNSAEHDGGALYVEEDTAATNVVLWGNTATSGAQVGNRAIIALQSCVLEGGLAAISGPGIVNDLGGNRSDDPLFEEPADPDGPDDRFATADDGLRLGASSPAIDAGTLTGAPATDLIGTERPQGAGIDVGAYERL